MSVSDRARELIQKSLEAIASESELAELETMLAIDPEVAAALADAARLHVGLVRYFQKQQKLDQVALLLNRDLAQPDDADSPSGNSDSSDFDISDVDLCQFDPGHIDPAMATAGPSISSYRARDSKVVILPDSARGRRARFLKPNRKWAAIALLLLVGAFLWSWWGTRSRGDRFRIVSGSVAIAGRTDAKVPVGTKSADHRLNTVTKAGGISEVPLNVSFEVVGGSPAVLELPGGTRFELTLGTRGSFQRAAGQRGSQPVVLALESGGGVLTVSRGGPACRVKTGVADVATEHGKVSFTLFAAESLQISRPAAERQPRLTVSVSEGLAMVEHAGTVTWLRAGESRTFFKQT